MRIMQIVSGGDVNGAIVHCLGLTRELAQLGHEVTLVCKPRAWIGQQPFPPGVEIIESNQYPFSARDIRQASQLIRAREVEILHTHQGRASFFGVLLKLFTGVPSVATAHCRRMQLHWMWNDHVIAVSRATRNFHLRYNFCRPRNTSVIPCFVDAERFSNPSCEARRLARAEFGIDSDQPVVGVVGQVCKRKGLIYLVKALPAIRAAVPQVRVLIVGIEDGPYASAVRDSARQLGVSEALIWAGRRIDVERLLPAFDLFVLPSLEEQMPLAILEAMAAGLPVISTTVGGIPECVSDGTEGLLVPPADPRPLARAVATLLTNEVMRLEMGKAGRNRALNEFSPARNAKRVDELFKQILATRGTLPAARTCHSDR
jgi:glycosyltransferase involved in cell wall biosynthesis